MRIFFVLMVLLNLAWFGWQTWQDMHAELDRASQADAAINSSSVRAAQNGVASLVLLSELSAEQLPRIQALTNSAATPGQVARPESIPAPGGLAEANAAVGEPTAAGAGQMPEIAELTNSGGAGAVMVASVAGQIPPADSPLCSVIEAIGSQELRDQLVMMLEEEGLAANVESYEVPVSSTWWVHFPAFASEELAQRILLELQGKSIDSYYMRSGQLAGGISLGVFSRQESAVSAQAGFERRGYRTEISEVLRMQQVYRVSTDRGLDAIEAAPRVRLFLEANQGLEVSEIVCESVAQGLQFP